LSLNLYHYQTLGVDAVNIRSGGGATHLKQLLVACEPELSGFKTVVVWTGANTASQLPVFPWLIVQTAPWMDGPLPVCTLGQQRVLPRLVKQAGCDVLFSPGGTLPARCLVPMVTMSQNMLPFERDRAALFGRWSWMRLKMRLLRFSQGWSFKRAQGVIFLTQYAQDTVTKALGGIRGLTALVPHGIEQRFVMHPRAQRSQQALSQQPLQLLYVSIQMPYKHHLELMRAVAQLKAQGRSVVLRMVGGHVGRYADEVQHQRLALDPEGAFLQDLGHVNFEQLHELYQQADVFVFASSCENLPNILIEAMAAGLPIACAQRGPMPEVLGDAGVYFDPESPETIAQAIASLADDPNLRAQLAQRAWQKAQAYSWERCARETLDFVAQVARKHTKVME
jgi:glycosyltransferase involved in cell wall biosynthesis